MKKYSSILAVALMTGLWAVPASAVEQYVSGNVGMTWTNDIKGGSSSYVLDSGTNVLVALGADEKHLDYRFEGEIGYQTSGINSFGSSAYRGDVHVFSLLANGYYDIYTGEVFKPYVTAGAGAVLVKFNDLRDVGQVSGYSEHETAFAYQVGVGVTVPVTPDIKFDARCRYFSTADFRMDNGNMTHFSSTSLLIGLRFRL